ncbi:tryptophan halogenase family protein [Sphingomonas sp.]|uniref:tryptophan halogenase family protein n=1 Tax=Sphingomonas sp. TaxID=28214 RepID=UPI001B08B660|nr:tryptophan halogenase family protein [Sphingomonas sp.]MBO9713438.1 tryptophan 7-halogenase [Sphingomonas sp.]
MNAQGVQRVVVVGGGTAGWMTAAALVKLLPRRVSVRLVESEAIGIVGVGEATLPHIRAFNERMGIREADFMAWTRGTFKLGIEFADWGALGESYIHPFGTFGYGAGTIDFHQYWLRLRQSGVAVPDLQAFSVGVQIARRNKFQLPDPDPRTLGSTFAYAYQFDATLFAPYLRQIAESLGARRTEGRVVKVNLHGESGDIASLLMENGEVIEGDLFVDCSGFVSLLLGRALEEPFQDWSKWLPCDRAVAMPCRTETSLTPFTSATAMEAGWRWRIPLQHRTGNGYVFSSDFISEDEAATRLVGAVEGEKIADPRVLKFKAGRRERSWVKNCVGVGLASGFLEPLESTSIYLIQQAITFLLELFPEKHVRDVDRDEFNRLIDLEYDRIRDFLILHYHVTRRTDTEFWNYVRTMTVPDTLHDKIELFRRSGRVVKYREGVFLDASWIAVYLGQGIVPVGHDPRVDGIAAETLAAGMEKLVRDIDATVAAMPDHRAHLEAYCPMAEVA